MAFSPESFYAHIVPDGGLARGYVALLDAIAAFRVAGHLAEAARAQRILRRMWAQYEGLSAQGPQVADEHIRARIRASAVRPPTSGQLERAIVSRPIPTTFPAGAVGIASYEALNSGAVNPRTGGIYWRTQEYGYEGNVGRRVRGYFMPGVSAPSQEEFRQHPYFEATPKGPRMVIRRPIEARHFLRDGTVEFADWHLQQERRIQRDALTALRAI